MYAQHADILIRQTAGHPSKHDTLTHWISAGPTAEMLAQP